MPSSTSTLISFFMISCTFLFRHSRAFLFQSPSRAFSALSSFHNPTLSSNSNYCHPSSTSSFPVKVPVTIPVSSQTRLHSSSSNNDNDLTTGTTTSMEYAIDPNSKEAKKITESMGLTPTQHSQLVDLAFLVVEWNDRINLISRKDCTPGVVFGRHILPSIALQTLLQSDEENNDGDDTTRKVMDVGTGGGFPGLPLAILFPKYEFTMVDSIGKKVKVVQAMADELGLKNVKTHHGRAEELYFQSDDDRMDICLGRSVAALPQFCIWIQNILKPHNKSSKLIYIIGGDVEEIVTSRCQLDISLDDLIPVIHEDEKRKERSDKRALVLPVKEVKLIAKESDGEVKPQTQKPKTMNDTKKKKSTSQKKKRDPKGAWEKKNNSVVKDRGYENFKRYNS